MPENNKNYRIFNTLIMGFLVLQVISVSASIALSSIAFGTWMVLWMVQLAIYRREPSAVILRKELKLIIIFIALYAIAELVSRIFAVYPDGALIGLKRLLLFFIMFAAMFKIPDRKALHFTLFILILTVSLVSIYELVKYLIAAPTVIPEKGFGETRIDYLSYPLTSGEIKIMVLMSVLPLLFIKERFFLRKRYLLVICAPIFLSMLLTQSRNVYLALVICLIVFGFVKNWKVLLAGAAVFLLLLFILPTEYTGRFTSIFDSSHGSNAGRITLWLTGWKMFLANPFFGVGDNMIMEVYSQYKYPLSEWEHSHLHSNIFMILVTTGLFGFLSLAGFFITVFVKMLKYYNEFKNESDCALLMGSILMFIAFQVCGVFEWSFGDHEVITVFFFLLSVPFVLFKLNEKIIRH